MNTAPDVLNSPEKFDKRHEPDAWVPSEEAIDATLWAEKARMYIRGVASVLAVVRKDLVPEVEKIALRLFLLTMLLFELFRCTMRR